MHGTPEWPSGSHYGVPIRAGWRTWPATGSTPVARCLATWPTPSMGLTSAGLLALADADPESCSARRITVTDRGCARYVALRQIHNPRARVAVGTPHRWARSSHDQRSHLLAQIGVLVAVCGHRMPWSTRTSAAPTGRQCTTCQALAPVQVTAPGTARRAGLRVPDPQFPTTTPAGCRSRSPAPLPAPGGQPDPSRPGGGSTVGQLRWTRGAVDGRLHLLQPADIVTATGGHAQALCLTSPRSPPAQK